jgi:hypothetical protein
MTPDDPTQDDAAQTRRGRYGWPSLALAVLFGLLYAYDLWEAVGNLIGIPALYSAVGLSPVPWWLLIVGVLLPAAVYVAALRLGRRLGVGGRALLFLLGLAVVAALSLGVVALEVVLRPAL